MNVIKLFRTATLALAMAGLSAGSLQAGDVKAAEFSAAIEKAETARKKAASVGGEWRDTGKMIKKAKAAAKNGDYDKAIIAFERLRTEYPASWIDRVAKQRIETLKTTKRKAAQ